MKNVVTNFLLLSVGKTTLHGHPQKLIAHTHEVLNLTHLMHIMAQQVYFENEMCWTYSKTVSCFLPEQAYVSCIAHSLT